MFFTLSIILLLLLIVILIVFIACKRPKKTRENLNHHVANPIKLSDNIINQIDIPIYYINLDKSPERDEFMKNQFKRYGIKNYKRVQAINGTNIKQSIKQFAKKHTYKVNGISFWNNYTNLKHNELACTLSHLNAIRTAYQDGHDMVLITEDDASFGLMPYWNKKLSQYTHEFPSNWGCVSLFNMACYIDKDLPAYIHIKDKICNGSVAYIINKKGMESALETMSTELLVMDKNHPKNHNIKSKLTSLADVFIFNRIDNCYERKIPIIFPYNDSNQDSTIHTHHTWRHNLFANEIIKMYNSSLSLKDLK
jgi:GR25 family glycosyltransferase involved in LPS biosynthesis